MSSATFDTHAYIKRLQQAGFSEEQAEAQAQGMIELVNQQAVTKPHFDSEIGMLRHEMTQIEHRLERRISDLELRLTLRLGGMLIAAVVALGALITVLAFVT